MRRKTHAVMVGDITVGGSAPVVVQSMTNTDTADVAATVAQVIDLAKAGSELVRITVNNEASAAAVGPIRKELDALGVKVPLVGIFTSTAIACWRNILTAPGRWPSTVSIPATWAVAKSGMSSSTP